MDNKKGTSVSTRASDAQALSESSAGLLRELVAHLRQNRTQLREEWARRITRAELLTAMTEEEIFAEATAVYDNYVEALETGTFEALQAYSRSEEHTSELQSRLHLVCRLLLEKKKHTNTNVDHNE